jgi:hypothetical protein
MPKLISTTSEGLAIRGLLVKDKSIRGQLMATLTEQHFRTPQTQKIFYGNVRSPQTHLTKPSK